MQEGRNLPERATPAEPLTLFLFIGTMTACALGAVIIAATIILMVMKTLDYNHPSSPAFLVLGILFLLFGEYCRRRLIRNLRTNRQSDTS